MHSVVHFRVMACALGALLVAAPLAGCKTDPSGLPVVAAAPAAPAPKPLTHQQAALDCWMATEHGHKDMPLDKRADIVDACIKDKMAGKPVPNAAAAADSYGKPQASAKPKT
jgi:hypothetical protein